jgi:hypothetical protein
MIRGHRLIEPKKGTSWIPDQVRDDDSRVTLSVIPRLDRGIQKIVSTYLSILDAELPTSPKN